MQKNDSGGLLVTSSVVLLFISCLVELNVKNLTHFYLILQTYQLLLHTLQNYHRQIFSINTETTSRVSVQSKVLFVSLTNSTYKV